MASQRVFAVYISFCFRCQMRPEHSSWMLPTFSLSCLLVLSRLMRLLLLPVNVGMSVGYLVDQVVAWRYRLRRSHSSQMSLEYQMTLDGHLDVHLSDLVVESHLLFLVQQVSVRAILE